MEKNKKESDESFESVIKSLTQLVKSTLNLSEDYMNICLDGANYQMAYLVIESKIHKYLNDLKNIQTLQHYLKILNRYTDKKIKEVLPDGIQYGWGVLPRNEDIRRVVRSVINDGIAFITKILNEQKILSPRTKYFDYKGTSQRMFAFETALIKGQLIERTKYFLEIFQGKAPNEKINWTGTASSFRYFIDNLFFAELFENLTEKWVIAENTFTIKGNPVPENIRTYKEKDVKSNTKLIINDAISRLID